MAIRSVSYDLDDIGSTTLQLIRPKVADTIFESNIVYETLKARGQVNTESGGKWIETRLLYAKNETVKSYKGYGKLATFPTESLTGAQFPWTQYSGCVMISGEEEAINGGESQLIGLLKHQTKLLEMSAQDTMGTHALALSTAKDPVLDSLGLEQIIEAKVGTDQGTLGGIDKEAYTWWRNQYAAFDYENAVDLGDPNPLWTNMTTMLNNCMRQKLKPSDYIIVTTQTIDELFEKENHAKVRINYSDMRPMDVGATGGKRFKGVPMYWDPHVFGTEVTDAHRIFFVALPHLAIEVHKNRNFAMTPFRTPTEQDAKVAYLLWMIQMTSDNNRHHGVILCTPDGG